MTHSVPLAVVRRLLPLLELEVSPAHWAEAVLPPLAPAPDAATLAADIARLGQRLGVALVLRPVPPGALAETLNGIFHPLILLRRSPVTRELRVVLTWCPDDGRSPRQTEELDPATSHWVPLAMPPAPELATTDDSTGRVLLLFPLALPPDTPADPDHDPKAAPPLADITGLHSHVHHLTPWQRLLALVRLERRDIGYIYIYTLAVGALNLVLPLGVQALIGFMSGGLVGTSIVVLVTLIIASIVLSGILQVQQISIVEVLQRRVFTRTALDFARRLPRIEPTAGWVGEYPPEQVNRFFDVLNVQKGLPKLLIDISAALLQILFGLLVLSFYHPFFIFFALLLLSVAGLIVWSVGPRGLTTSITESKYKYRVAYWLEEVARALPAFRLAPRTGLPVGRTHELVSGYLHHRKEHFKVLMTLYAYAVAFKSLVVGGLLILATVLLTQRQISLGQIVASELIIVLIVTAVEKLILSLDVVYDLLTALDKIGHFTDKPLEEVAGLPVDTTNGLRVAFEGVTTYYPLTDRVVARNARLVIEPGARLGLTSADPEATADLCRTLLGQMPYTGALTINNLSITNFDRELIRQLIGETITQRDIFAGSVLDNLTLGRPGISPTDLHTMLTGLRLQELVNQLPQGLATELVPADPALPEALISKILLGRAVLTSPHLLLLRDPTELEPADRRRVLTWLFDRQHAWSVVCLTDSPAVLRQLDQVAVVRGGQVSEPTAYDDLLTRDPAFRELMADLVA